VRAFCNANLTNEVKIMPIKTNRFARRHLLPLQLLACLAPSLSAFAVTTTANMAVSATVVATCLITASPMAFGPYTGLQVDTTATVTITCTNTTTYSVGLDAGTSTGATVTTRKMGPPVAGLLAYALFSDTGRTANWGNTTPTWVTGTGNGAAQPLTVYGRLASGQFVAPGAYTDTIVATVTY
jgi:spore coat protein U-like protein